MSTVEEYSLGCVLTYYNASFGMSTFRWSARSAVECGGSKGIAVRVEMRGTGEVGGGARRAQPIGPRVDRTAESGAARRPSPVRADAAVRLHPCDVVANLRFAPP